MDSIAAMVSEVEKYSIAVLGTMATMVTIATIVFDYRVMEKIIKLQKPQQQ